MRRYGLYVQPLSTLAKVGVEGSNPFARSRFPALCIKRTKGERPSREA